MQRPSVLFINRVYPPVRGASGRVLRDLAQAFAEDGWDVTILTSGPRSANVPEGAIRIVRLKGPDRPGNLLVYGWVWLKFLLAGLFLPRADLIITLTDPPLLVVVGHILKTFRKCHHMHWCQDLYPDLLPVLGFRLPGFVMNILKRIGRYAMRHADRVVVIGRCMARQLGQDGFDPRQISLIPNWADPELYEMGAPPPAMPGNVEAREGAYDVVANAYRSPDQQIKHGPKFRVLYAGNLGRAHPVSTILEAASLLQQDHPEIEFVFVGDGPRNDKLAKERARKNLDNIRLLPYQPASRLRELMESGDVHIVTMKDEAAGLLVPVKLYAALAIHRPCILLGPARSETAKIITDFQTGSVVEQGNAKRLADEIRQMRLDSDKWFAAHEGAKQAAQIFVPAESIKAWLERARTVIK